MKGRGQLPIHGCQVESSPRCDEQVGYCYIFKIFLVTDVTKSNSSVLFCGNVWAHYFQNSEQIYFLCRRSLHSGSCHRRGSRKASCFGRECECFNYLIFHFSFHSINFEGIVAPHQQDWIIYLWCKEGKWKLSACDLFWKKIALYIGSK